MNPSLDLCNRVGGIGNDSLDGGSGNDTLDGGSGDDVYTINSAQDQILEGIFGGTDRGILDGFATYLLGVEIENAQIIGNAAVAITGNTLNNDLTGGGGKDTLTGAAGKDTMGGGAGDDTCVVDNLNDVLVENPSQGLDRVQTSLAAYELGLELETLVGTSTGKQALTGSAVANRIKGGTNSNPLDGAGGGDTMLGGQGNDLYLVDASGDVVSELSGAGTGTDTVSTALNNYTLTANVETLEGAGAQGQTLKGNDLGNRILAGTGADTLGGALGPKRWRAVRATICIWSMARATG